MLGDKRCHKHWYVFRRRRHIYMQDKKNHNGDNICFMGDDICHHRPPPPPPPPQKKIDLSVSPEIKILKMEHDYPNDHLRRIN